MIGEHWLPVPGLEGWYDVSLAGRVRSWVERVRDDRGRVGTTGRRLRRPFMLAGRARTAAGYPAVNLGIPGRRRRAWCVHWLVLLAFRGPRPSGFCSRHLDGSRENNRLENLVYGTAKENTADTKRHGRASLPPRMLGEAHPNHKLTEAAVREARQRAASGEIVRTIAASLHVDECTVHDAVARRTWVHVE